jgi:predicted O-methyltransferase YrrM
MEGRESGFPCLCQIRRAARPELALRPRAGRTLAIRARTELPASLLQQSPSMKQRHPLARRASEFHALQKPRELSELLWLVEEHPPRSVLEIGTFAGGTLYCLCRLAQPDATIISVDKPMAKFGGGYTDERADEMEKLFPREQQTLTLIRGDSHLSSTLERINGILDGGRLDLLFIDGDHTYEGVRSDFEMYSPLVTKGGIVVFHDILDHDPGTGCEVSTYWNEIKDDYEHVEFAVAPYRWGGIGVLWKT